MFSDLPSLRDKLTERLKVALPETWRFASAVERGPIEALVPVLYLEYKRLEGSVNGQPLARDQIACHVDIIIATAGTDQENEADTHIADLALALQSFDDLYWSTAEKIRLDSGQLAWRVATIAIATAPEE